MSEQAGFDPLGLVRALGAAHVRYILIGGYAAQIRGSGVLTGDLDICYARDKQNLEALAAALRGLEAALRGAPPGLPFKLDGRTLANGDSFTFTTVSGDLDVLGTPSGTEGYDDLARSATQHEIEGVRIAVASIDDLIRMKRAAGRVKDLLHLEQLGALRDELDRPGS
jgi:hypothetical protein